MSTLAKQWTWNHLNHTSWRVYSKIKLQSITICSLLKREIKRNQINYGRIISCKRKKYKTWKSKFEDEKQWICYPWPECNILAWWKWTTLRFQWTWISIKLFWQLKETWTKTRSTYSHLYIIIYIKQIIRICLAKIQTRILYTARAILARAFNK